MVGILEGYRKTVGGTQSKPQLYAGFTLFFAGAIAGVASLVVLAAGNGLIEDLRLRREFAGILGGIAFPAFFFGLQLTLPSRWLIQMVAGLGAAVMLFSTWLFSTVYPHEWNQIGADRSTEVIGWLVLGLVLLVTTVALSLVLNYVSRFVALPGQEHVDDVYAEYGREPTMEEILGDIEREVGRQGLTWGGMSGAQLANQMVKIRADFGADAIINPTAKAGKVVSFQDTSDENAFQALLKMRGRDRDQTSAADDTEGAIATLKALRQKAQAERERSWWYRFKRWVISLFTGGRPPSAGGRAE